MASILLSWTRMLFEPLVLKLQAIGYTTKEFSNPQRTHNVDTHLPQLHIPELSTLNPTETPSGGAVHV